MHISVQLLKKVDRSNPKLASDLKASIVMYNKYISRVPANHSWQFKSSSAMVEELIKIKEKDFSNEQGSILEQNKIFWADRVQSIKAAEMFFLYRSGALFNSVLTSLNYSDFLTTAILSRSLLELCIWHIYYSSWIELNTRSIPRDPELHVLGNTKLDDEIAKLLFGSKEKNVHAELEQNNILKIMKIVAKKLNKKGNFIDIELFYDFFCEFTHPNAGGNNLFVKDCDIRSEGNWSIPRLLNLSAMQNDDKKKKVLDNSINVINWSFPAVIHGSQQYQKSIQHIVKNFKFNTTLIH